MPLRLFPLLLPIALRASRLSFTKLLITVTLFVENAFGEVRTLTWNTAYRVAGEDAIVTLSKESALQWLEAFILRGAGAAVRKVGK